jgi:hypothetical protein
MGNPHGREPCSGSMNHEADYGYESDGSDGSDEWEEGGAGKKQRDLIVLHAVQDFTKYGGL